MRSTIVNFFFKQAKSKTPQEIEEEQQRREERLKIKEAKKAVQKQVIDTASKKPAKEKKKPNLLSAEDKINEFMRQMHEREV